MPKTRGPTLGTAYRIAGGSEGRGRPGRGRECFFAPSLGSTSSFQRPARPSQAAASASSHSLPRAVRRSQVPPHLHQGGRRAAFSSAAHGAAGCSSEQHAARHTTHGTPDTQGTGTGAQEACCALCSSLYALLLSLSRCPQRVRGDRRPAPHTHTHTHRS